jgi:hypothetical protein
MTEIRITVYAGRDENEARPPTTIAHEPVPMCDVHEELRRIGLEYKQADYFSTRQVLIVLEPVEPRAPLRDVQSKIREAAMALEGTGLL